MARSVSFIAPQSVHSSKSQTIQMCWLMLSQDFYFCVSAQSVHGKNTQCSTLESEHNVHSELQMEKLHTFGVHTVHYITIVCNKPFFYS